jgi:anion-transporting  ArsA/GET3 family ATPase
LDEQKQTYETKLTELQASLTSVQKELDELKPKYDDLAAYKQKAEEAEVKKAKLASIRQKFIDANLDITDDYFNERAETFAGMSDELLSFFIQDLVAAFKPPEEGKASISITSKTVPPIKSKEVGDVTPKDILEYLNKSDKK